MSYSNIIIFKSLIAKETKRFMKVFNQTIISPVITSMIFYMIFILAAGESRGAINGIKYQNYIGSGLIIMTMMQQAFSNTSSSITISKMNGAFVDYLITPISPNNFINAFCTAATLRSMIVGGIIFSIMQYLLDFQIHNLLMLIFMSLLGSYLLSLLGLLAGFVSESFEQMTSFTTYFITPLSFLSGTFYSVKDLPSYLEKINYVNPFFYVIDLFRYSLTGQHESNMLIGISFLTCFSLALYLVAYIIIKTGYKVQS